MTPFFDLSALTSEGLPYISTPFRCTAREAGRTRLARRTWAGPSSFFLQSLLIIPIHVLPWKTTQSLNVAQTSLQKKRHDEQIVLPEAGTIVELTGHGKPRAF